MKTLLVLCVVCTLVVLSVSATAEQKLKNCNEVRAAYSSKGFNVNDVPNKGVNGEFYLDFFRPVHYLKHCSLEQGFPNWGSGTPRGSWLSLPVVLRLMVTFKLATLA